MDDSVQRPFALELLVRRIDLLYRQNLTAPVINSVAVLFFIPLTWQDLPHARLVAWVAVLLMVTLIRLCATLQWRHRRDAITTFREVHLWHAFMTAGISIAAFCYGLMGMWTIHLNPMHQMFIAFFLIAACSGSSANYSSSLPCSMATIFAITLPWMIGALMRGGHDYNLLAAIILFYTIMHVRVSANLCKYVLQSSKLNMALYEKEQRLRIGRDSSGAMGWTWDIPTQTFTCEGQLDKIFGQGEVHFTHGLSDYVRLVHPDDRIAFQQAIQDAVKSGTLDTEHRLLWPSGEIHYLSIRGRTEYNSERSPMRMIGIGWDVTAKKTEERLRHERDSYEASNKAKMVFLANASHEIRTPLAAINGFAEMILQFKGMPFEAREDLKAILRNGKYLAAVVNDLLDLSKADTDHLYMQRSAISPVSEIGDALQVVQVAAEHKGLKLQVAYETLMPETVYADATRFRQILINLLSNSVKYTDRGGITVTVGCRPQGVVNVFYVMVSDTGIGISEEAARNLFQPFARDRSERVQRLPGSGLGLALSRSLARQMGGDLILVPDQVGDGCSFRLTINPGDLTEVAFVPADQLALRLREAVAPPSTKLALEGRSIMVVEDDDDLRELMQRFLEDQGAKVVTSANGKEAVDRAFGMTFSSIVMDIKMPVMDGYQATSMLREMGYRNPIIALTAHASVHDRQMCFQAGCNAYLSKPVDTQHLLDVLIGQGNAGNLDAATI